MSDHEILARRAEIPGHLPEAPLRPARALRAHP
jgi:hypothetical protein